MIQRYLLSTLIIFFTLTSIQSQNGVFPLSVELTIDNSIAQKVEPDGRFFLFLSEHPNVEPRTQLWPNPFVRTHIFAKNVSNIKQVEVLNVKNEGEWISTAEWNLNKVPEGVYYVQALWDQDVSESRIDAPGNVFSKTQKVTVEKSTKVHLTLDQEIEKRAVLNHKLSREVDFKSEVLSSWWQKPVYLKASILLPHNYDSQKAYPIRYNVAGYGGRYTRINYVLKDEDFMNWWESDKAPQVITVFLDGEGPYGDSYQMDSENSGPYGQALIDEFIPYIESQFRGTSSATTRFVDGCSTGGWVSLALQLYYPDSFNGAFSYSPDAIEFENYQLINIYRDQNAYVNEFGYERPVMRDISGEPMVSLKDFVQVENVLGSSNTYLNSGGQFSAHTALYSPKGENGLPKPIFDPFTGVIDHKVAEHWKKYDFKLYAEEHWEELGPKLQGKIYIWMGDMDHFYLNPATRAFDDFLKSTRNPTSDAEVEFSAMEGHCSQYSHKTVLLQIQDKLDLMSAE